jgi:hypothetical protein
MLRTVKDHWACIFIRIQNRLYAEDFSPVSVQQHRHPNSKSVPVQGLVDDQAKSSDFVRPCHVALASIRRQLA